MAERIALVVRELNKVASAGQARAAVNAALAELARGTDMVPDLSPWSTPDPGEAYSTLTLLRGALDGEARGFSAQADDSQVDPQAWSRARRQVERAYVEVSGIEGAAGAAAAVDPIAILADAIADAPRVLGNAVGQIAAGAGQVVGSAAGGILAGLGVVGILVVAAVIFLALRSKGVV
ncbi:MAG: hypothetical protein ACJ8GN_02105 [Longimicrobiaceae bacterium]